MRFFKCEHAFPDLECRIFEKKMNFRRTYRGFTLKFLTLHRGEMKVNKNSSSLQLTVLGEITFWVLRSSVIQVRLRKMLST